MGKVRPEHVKRLARELVERFPDVFTKDFETNKKLVETHTNSLSVKLRNRIAGYTTRLVAIKADVEPSEATNETDSQENALPRASS